MESAPSIHPTWFTTVKRNLERRDAVEKQPYVGVINNYNELLQKFLQSKDSVRDLERTLTSLREQVLKNVKSESGPGSEAQNRIIADLQDEISNLKTERAELYKTQGQNAQRLLEMTEKLRMNEEEVKRLREENAIHSQHTNALSTKAADLQGTVKEKDATIQILQDELQTLQLELNTNEEKMERMSRENQQLVDRWMKKMEEDAEKMNEANRFIESVTALQEHARTAKPQQVEPVALPSADTNASRSSQRQQPQLTAPPVQIPSRASRNSISSSQSPAIGLGAFKTSLTNVLGSVIGGKIAASGIIDNRTISVPPPSTDQENIVIIDQIDSIKVTPCFHPDKLVGVHRTIADPTHLSISQTAGLLATGGADKRLRLYATESIANTTTNKADPNVLPPFQSLSGPIGSIIYTCFSPDSNSIAVCSADNSIQIYSLSTYRVRHTLTGHIGKVTCCAFISDNSIKPTPQSQRGQIQAPSDYLVISGSQDRTIKLWDLRKGFCVKTLFGFSSVNDIHYIGNSGIDGIVSAHWDGKVRIWDLGSASIVRELDISQHQNQVLCVGGLGTDPNTVYALSKDNTFKFIDIRTYEVTDSISHPDFKLTMNTRCCVSPDGQFLAAGAVDGSVFIWNVEKKGDPVTILSGGHNSPVVQVVWNPKGGSQMYSIDKSGVLCTWGV
ncbi:WD40-repeat-containing domain protein [Paraphysoderma sedebokerense]|nr:WD40-repeat-containing domain protein [Paraphysoderma sedebokerense]